MNFKKKRTLSSAWTRRLGAALLCSSCAVGTPPQNGPSRAPAPASTAATAAIAAIAEATPADPDPTLRPKVSPAERERLELSLPARAAEVTEALNAGRTRFGLGEDDQLQLFKAQVDPYGSAHFRFRQLHHGLRVMGVGMVTHPDDVGTADTLYLAPRLAIDTEPTVDTTGAKRIAEQAFPAPGAGPLDTRLELAIEPVLEYRTEPDASGAVTNSDQTHREVTGYRLVYLAQVAVAEPEDEVEAPLAVPTEPAPRPGRSHAPDAYSMDDATPESESAPFDASSVVLADGPQQIIIDAKTGRILSQREDVRHAGDGIVSTGNSFYNGLVDLSTRFNAQTSRFEMKDPYRAGNEVRDLKNGTSSKAKKTSRYVGTNPDFGDGLQFEDGQDTASVRGETAAVDVAFALERTWDMLLHVYGRKGLDAKGTSVNPRVHFGHQYNDAHWSNRFELANFGDGTKCCTEGVTNTAPLTRLEVVGHELGHGVWQYELGSSNDAVAAGINEGHGDVMGSLAEFYAFGHDGLASKISDDRAGWNWKGRMVNPAGYTEKVGADTYIIGLRYFSPNLSSLPEHVVGTLYGHAFVMLAHGASANPKSTMSSFYLPNGSAGIGASRAGELWYVATTAFLPEEPDFNQLRAAYLAAAKSLYGEGSRVHHAVQDAFGAVGVGSVSVDSQAPVISEAHVAELDEGEGSVLVVTSPQDDTGILRTEFRLGLKEVSANYEPFSAYLDVTNMGLGAAKIRIKALDRTLKEANQEVPVTLVGANQLLVNGNFEGGASGWTWTGQTIAKFDNSRPATFMGSWNAVFSALDQISQPVLIPAESTSAKLTFRVRVQSDAADLAKLSVVIKNTNSGIESTVAVYGRDDGTYSTPAHHYRKGTIDLTSRRGEAFTLRFVANADTGDGDFAIDNVSLTYAAPVNVNAPLMALHEDEQTLRFTFAGLTGYSPSRIKRVDYVVGGVVKASETQGPSFESLISTKGWPTGVAQVVARVYDSANHLVGQSTGVPLTLKGVNQALVNGDFEGGAAPWLLAGPAGVSTDSEGLHFAFLGSKYARLGGLGVPNEGFISQIVGLPQGIISAQLSYRLSISTQEDNMGGTDKLLVEAQVLPDGQWQTLETVNANTNLNAGESYQGYQRRTVSLTALRGNTVRLRFRVIENAGLLTAFRLDNISATYVSQVVSP